MYPIELFSVSKHTVKEAKMGAVIHCVACWEPYKSPFTFFPSFSTHRSHSSPLPPKLAMAPSEPLSLTPVQDSPLFDYPRLDQQLIHTIAYDALVWSSLHGLLVGDKSVQVTHSPTFLLSFIHCIAFRFFLLFFLSLISYHQGFKYRSRRLAFCGVCWYRGQIWPMRSQLWSDGQLKRTLILRLESRSRGRFFKTLVTTP